MKERMAEISEEPTSNHNDTKHTNATSLDIGLFIQAKCPSNPDIEEYVIRCHIGVNIGHFMFWYTFTEFSPLSRSWISIRSGQC
jgi:tRNA splicing ligase